MSKSPLFVACLWLIVACGSGPSSNDHLEEYLSFGMIPSEEAERMVKNVEPVKIFLEKELGIPVKIFKGTDYTAIIEGMRADKIDVAMFGPFSYVLASKNAGAQPLVVPSKPSGEPATYSSLIVTTASSPIQTLEQLLEESGKYTLSFSDPASTSGHLVPRGQLHTMGITPEEHFTEILFSGNHTATILSVASGKVDVAGCSFVVYNKMIERQMLDPKDIRILWQSRPLPVDLITIRQGLPEAFREKLLDAYVRVAKEEPASAGYFYNEWNDSSLVFLPAHDSMYADIRKFSSYLNEEI